MALHIDPHVTAEKLVPKIKRLFEVSSPKILSLEKNWDSSRGTPVFTVRGKYTTRGWTEWTQGFQFGSALLQFDATGEKRFLEIGRAKTIRFMAPHVSHMGVHDHGFNNISTYGKLWRLMSEGRIPFDRHEKDLYELALKLSGAVQAARWTNAGESGGFIYSFNGPHSLFIDTMRSLRSLAVAYQLGHVLMGEHDEKISLLERLIRHGMTSAGFSVYYGSGRDLYDKPGRVAQESIFNINDGTYRCASSQQGYSPFSTWTRGLAWAVLGFAEELEFLDSLRKEEIANSLSAGVVRPIVNSRRGAHLRVSVDFIKRVFRKAAVATADFYLANSCADGIPLWDTDAPNQNHLGDYLSKPADPYNAWEPVDSSAAAIAAQGMVRLGNYFAAKGGEQEARKYRGAGLTIAGTLFDEPYLCAQAKHQGLLLHSVYHRPNEWDYIAPGQKVPNGESSMWGDYHARELACLILREARGESYPTFFDPSYSGPSAG